MKAPVCAWIWDHLTEQVQLLKASIPEKNLTFLICLLLKYKYHCDGSWDSGFMPLATLQF